MYKIIFILIVSLLILTTETKSQVFNDQVYKFSKVLSLVKTFYVDSVNQDDLLENAIVGMLKELDPHSIYISKDEVDEMNEPLQGNFEGVGIQFNILNDTIVVISPISGGPSDKLGILAGDRIVVIEGKNVAGIGIKNKDVVSKLKGEKGTIVNVGIWRKGFKDVLDFAIIRDKIPIYSIEAAFMATPDAAYIKLNRFAATTMSEFSQAMDKLKKLGAKNLILDLQGNSGGYLNTAIELADNILGENKLIVYTLGVSSPKQEYSSTSSGGFTEGKIIILVDEGSASASEIVSGAIQDWDRGLILGRRTFGKGLVQRPFNLPDGSLIRLTIARYFTPTGRLIQKDYEGGYNEYSKDIINRYNHGELSNEDSIHFPDSLKFKTLILKRNVYGGGGIMPDFFIPIDTSNYSSYYRDLVRKGILNKFVLTYIDENRKALSVEHPEFAKYRDNYMVSDKLLDELTAFAEKEKLPMNKEEYNKSKEDIRTQLKALLARDLWDSSEFYEIMNIKNEAYLKAVELMKNTSDYNKMLGVK
ncbi:MAG: peptidase S41 [Bacteroidetes bacterium GWA2_30_7]|nr:MAG: peptidase S41 [Bacteroidetes bacterium GWA2_30_7]